MNSFLTNIRSKLATISRRMWYIFSATGVILFFVLFQLQETNVVTTVATYRELIDSVDLFGRIVANQESNIYPQVSGIIASVLVKPGDRIEYGQLLVRLESSELDATVADAYANLHVQQARMNITGIEYDEAEKNLALTKSRLDTTTRNALQDFLSGDLQAYTDDQDIQSPIVSGTYTNTERGEYIVHVYRSQSDSGYSFRYSGLESGSGTVQFKQAVPLGKRGLYITFIANSEYNNVTWRVPVPNIRSAQYTTLKSAYDTAVKNRDEVLHTNQSVLAKKQIEFGVSSTSLSQAQLAQARAQYDTALAKRNQYYIRAPFSGVIGYVGERAKIGELVDTQTRLASVVNNKGFKVRVKIPERSILRLTEGMSATVTLDADTSIQLTGVLQSISSSDSEVEGSRVYEGEIAIDGRGETSLYLRSGLGAFVSIQTAKAQTVLAIPETAVIKIAEQTYVSVQNDSGDFSNKLVVLGATKSGGFVQVLSGLQENDVIDASPETA